MAIDANIVNFGQSTPVADALSGIGSSVAGAITANKQAGLAENRKLAAGYLAQAFDDSSDEATTRALIEQAREADPEFTLATMNQLGIGQAKSNIDQQKLDLRRMELDARNLERAAKEETNELKRAELENKLELQKQKITEAKEKSMSKKEMVDSSIEDLDNLVGRMLDHEGLDSAVGGSSLFPTIPGSNSADFEAMFRTLKGKQFLTEIQKMKGQGSLSNSEGDKVAAAAESLDLTMSEDAFREALNRIRDGLATRKEVGTFNDDESVEANSDEVINWSDL